VPKFVAFSDEETTVTENYRERDRELTPTF